MQNAACAGFPIQVGQGYHCGDKALTNRFPGAERAYTRVIALRFKMIALTFGAHCRLVRATIGLDFRQYCQKRFSGVLPLPHTESVAEIAAPDKEGLAILPNPICGLVDF